MSAIPEVSAWADEVPLYAFNSLVIGGDETAVDNVPLVPLANRTRYLYDRINALTARPLTALPYPTVATATNKLSITPTDTLGSGGRVSVLSGQPVVLCEVATEGVSGRELSLLTPAWSSSDLIPSQTYFLRGRVSSGALQLYMQRGSDSDPVPAGLIGTPDAPSGGGFDSTPLDVLFARVTTGMIGSTPNVVPLANAARLMLVTSKAVPSVAPAASWTDMDDATHTLNWARTPQAQIALQGWASIGNLPDGSLIDASGTAINQQTQMIMLRNAADASRYSLLAEYAYDDESGDYGACRVVWTAIA